MSEVQFACALFALPFIMLSMLWLLGLSIVSRIDRAERIPVKVKEQRR